MLYSTLAGSGALAAGCMKLEDSLVLGCKGLASSRVLLSGCKGLAGFRALAGSRELAGCWALKVLPRCKKVASGS